jgi:hypothetical protein
MSLGRLKKLYSKYKLVYVITDLYLLVFGHALYTKRRIHTNLETVFSIQRNMTMIEMCLFRIPIKSLQDPKNRKGGIK